MISFTRSEDFGAETYFDRRRVPLEATLDSLLKSESIVDLFDDRLPQSETLRDYLWANEDDIVTDARRALIAVPPKIVAECIAWAIKHFGARQAGWPDLFVHREGEFLFVEVKSPNDRLSQEQMEWFQWAVSIHLPCTLLRIKKSRLRGR